MEYLSNPLKLREGLLDKTDLEGSIRYSVGLLICTRRGMLPFDAEYGSDLWEQEFSDFQLSKKSDIRSGLRNAVGKFEKRLYNVTVSVVSVDREQSGAGASAGVAVRVSGNYRDGEEEKRFESAYSLG